MKRFVLLMVTLGVVAGCTGPKVHLAGIGDTSWQVVKFQGGDGTVLTPDDKTKYTVTLTGPDPADVRQAVERGRRFTIRVTVRRGGRLLRRFTRMWPLT